MTYAPYSEFDEAEFEQMGSMDFSDYPVADSIEAARAAELYLGEWTYSHVKCEGDGPLDLEPEEFDDLEPEAELRFAEDRRWAH